MKINKVKYLSLMCLIVPRFGICVESSNGSRIANALADITFDQEEMHGAISKANERISKLYPAGKNKNTNIQPIDLKQLRNNIVDSYDRVLTEAEMQELVQFYRSPRGKKLLAISKKLQDARTGLFDEAMQKMLESTRRGS